MFDWGWRVHSTWLAGRCWLSVGRPNSSLLGLLEYTPNLAAGLPRAGDPTREEKPGGSCIFYDLMLEATRHHFYCHLSYVKIESLDPASVLERGSKTPPSAACHPPISCWSLALAAPEGRESKGASHAVSLSGQLIWKDKQKI